MDIAELKKLETETRTEIEQRRAKSARWWLRHIKFCFDHGIEISERAQTYLAGRKK